MKKMNFMIYFILTLSLLLSGCSAKEKDTKEEQQDTIVLKGRYAEQTVDFPGEINKIFDFAYGESGTLKVLIENEPGSLWLYESKDIGITWKKREGISAELFPENYGTKSACFGPEDSIIISAGKMIVDEYSQNQITGEYKYYELTEKGDKMQIDELQIGLPEPEEAFLNAGYGLDFIQVSDEGYLYGTVGAVIGHEAAYDAYQLVCAEKDSGRIIWSKDVTSLEFLLNGDEIYLEEYEKGSMVSSSGERFLQRLKADTGEENGEYKLQQGLCYLSS